MIKDEIKGYASKAINHLCIRKIKQKRMASESVIHGEFKSFLYNIRKFSSLNKFCYFFG
jgi:hypothetical protein